METPNTWTSGWYQTKMFYLNNRLPILMLEEFCTNLNPKSAQNLRIPQAFNREKFKCVLWLWGHNVSFGEQELKKPAASHLNIDIFIIALSTENCFFFKKKAWNVIG